MVVFTAPNESHFIESDIPFSIETMELRRKAALTLVKLALPLSEFLKESIGPLISSISGLLTQKKIRNSEKHQLIEFLVVIITHSSMPDLEQAAYMQSFVNEDIQYMYSIQPHLATIDSFGQYIGIEQLVSCYRSGNQMVSESFKNNRHDVF